MTATLYEVSRSIAATIRWSTLWVLVVHFAFSFFEFERYEPNGGRVAASAQIEPQSQSPAPSGRR